jgi:hypothetical protein
MGGIDMTVPVPEGPERRGLQQKKYRYHAAKERIIINLL